MKGVHADRKESERMEVEQSKEQKSHSEAQMVGQTREGQQESQECPCRTDRLLKPKAYHSIADEVMGGPQNQP